jgi:hypothetical protein
MSGRVFDVVRMRDDVLPVKPWAVVCSVAPELGCPRVRAVHWFWTQRGAVGAARYLRALLREDLLGAEPFGIAQGGQ